jgi:hypothetical protein
MATITRYNSVQFSEVSNQQLAGVTLVYRSTDKDGNDKYSAVHLGGAEFVPENGTEAELFRVWKNAIKLHWDAKRQESGLKIDNGGIAVKLRASTPYEIVVRDEDGFVKLCWESEDSVFARIGIMPTARDLVQLERDYKKKLHKAAKASFEAMKLKFEFAAAESVDDKEDVKENAAA